jgi:hypothetical protein
MVNRLELVAWLVGLIVAWLIWRPARPLRRGLVRLADNRALSVLLVGLLAALASAAISITLNWPQPKVHDEFSYLLAADTFAARRLANPPHSLWTFFETFHVNQQPVYASMYPPGQGLFLALGRRLAGQPLAGVWLSFGLACAAVCWMLQAYLPPRWALFGGLLCAVRVGLLGGWAGQQGYWSQSYWGGAVAMLGGALVFGAVPRLVRRPHAGTAAVLGLGWVVLANSRPFEGAAASLPAAAAVAAWLCRGPSPRRVRLVRGALPLALVLGPSAAAMAYYNQRLTGDPLRLPYQLNGDQYGLVPLFLWQPLHAERPYRHEAFREYHEEWAREKYLAKRSPAGWAADLARRVEQFAGFFLGIGLLVPLAALPQILRDRRMRLAAAGCAAAFAALSVTTWYQPHYAAPIAGPLFALVVQGLRYVRLWRRHGRPAGRWFVAALPYAYLGLSVAACAEITRVPADAWHLHRARLEAQWEADGGRHLVIVRYGPGHSCIDEWVYNRAAIDAAPVVWARDQGPEANQSLIGHFRNRHVWLLEVDGWSIRLNPYPFLFVPFVPLW